MMWIIVLPRTMIRSAATAVESLVRLDGGFRVAGTLPSRILQPPGQHADRAGRRDDVASLAFVQLAGVLVVRIHVELVAAHLPRIAGGRALGVPASGGRRRARVADFADARIRRGRRGRATRCAGRSAGYTGSPTRSTPAAARAAAPVGRGRSGDPGGYRLGHRRNVGRQRLAQRSAIEPPCAACSRRLRHGCRRWRRPLTASLPPSG